MIKIMVDSASDCNSQDNIYDLFVPLSINIDSKEYRGGIDLDSDTFYELLTTCKDFPHTSQPSPETFVELFEQVKADGDELIYFAISSALSGTYQGALIAKEMVDYDKIYIVDTLNATHMIGVLARYARKRIGEGASVEQIVAECEELKTRVKVLAGVDTLEYLRRGGRLSSTTAAVGTLANVKPIVSVTDEGKVESIGKAIGIGRAMQFIADRLAGFELDPDYPLCSLYTYGEENCEKLEEKLSSAGYTVSNRLQVGSVIGTHVGPGVYGVMFVTK